MSSNAPKTRDFFAELYVAGYMGDHGWAIYFPKRDVGFDFIASKKIGNETLIRPFQVKGLYPTASKKDKQAYGYFGRLTQMHNEMVLALIFFTTDQTSLSPCHMAFIPRSAIKTHAKVGYRCQPSKFIDGQVSPRKSFEKYFGHQGLISVESPTWG